MAQSYKELIAWRKAMELVVEVYRVTRSFPAEELYGLTSQLRRAAVSVPSNIAEGQARYSRRVLPLPNDRSGIPSQKLRLRSGLPQR